MATVPTPLDASAGTKLSAATFDAGVRDVFNFQLDPPRCELSMTANTALAAGTLTLVAWDTESSDTDSMHSMVSNFGRVTINTAGRYEFNIFTNLTATTAGDYNLNLRLNSGGSSAGGSSIRTWSMGSPGGTQRQQAVSLTRNCPTVGDYFELFVSTSSASTLQGGLGIFCTGIQVQWRSLT